MWGSFQRSADVMKCMLICSAVLLVVANASAQIVPKEALEKMASDEFKVREQGYLDLKKWAKNNAKQAPEILHKTWSGEADPEVKTRCFSIMKDAVILRKFGRGPGFVGVRMEQVMLPPAKAGEAATPGVRITMVLPNTPGQKAGLLAGDVVIKVDDVDFKKQRNVEFGNAAVDLMVTYIQSKHPGDIITLHLLRAGKKMEVKVKLMLRPDDVDPDPFGRAAESRSLKQERFFSDWLKEMSK